MGTKNFLFNLQTLKSNYFSSKKDNKPCIMTLAQTRGLSESEIIKQYKPALIHSKVHIPLEIPEAIKFPLSTEEINTIKNNLRYVWCDGYEDTKWMPRQCKYLGIRLSKSFILHETVCDSTWQWGVHLLTKKCKARRIKLDELRLLDLVWDEVSNMRVKAEDAPLPTETTFWIEKVNIKNSQYDWANRKGDIYQHPTEGRACLLLAVQNLY